jgi:hypothetical protein
METTEQLFMSLLETGSITIELDEAKVPKLKTALHRIRKHFRTSLKSLIDTDTMKKRLFDDNLTTHYNKQTGYVTFELTTKIIEHYKVIKVCP